MGSKRQAATIAAGAALLAVFGVLTSAAQATAPGVPGDIAFQRYLGPDNSQGSIYLIHPDGTGERQVTSSPVGFTDRFPDVGPHSERIAFERCGDFCHVMSVKPDGTDLQSLTRMCGPGEIPPSCTEDTFPAWSPNGRHLAFVRVSGRLDEETGPDHVAIWIMHQSGEAPRAVTHPLSRVYEDNQPQWAPDGRRIVFVRLDVARDVRAIFTVRPNGHDPHQVTPWEIDAGDGPDISPDGTRVLFRLPEHGFEGTNLATMNLDGTDFRQLTNNAPGERMLSASYSPDGERITFAHDGIAGLPDIWTMKTDGTDVRHVTLNELWESAPDWGAR